MIEREFYLSTHDFVASPEPRECAYVDDSIVKETKQQLLRVDILPPMQDGNINTNWLLLGVVDPSLESLASTGERPFYVDIYVAGKKQHDSGYSCHDLIKIGLGVLHMTYESALADSPIDD